MQQRKTLALRLSAAVLTGGLLVTSAGTALAAPAKNVTAQSVTKKVADAKQDTYKLAKGIAEASTVGDLKAALGSNGGALADALKTVPNSTSITAEADNLDHVGYTGRDLARILASQLNPATEGDADACGTSEASAWVTKNMLPDPIDLATATPEESKAYTDAVAGTLLALLFGSNAPTYEAVWNGPDIKGLRTFGEEVDKTKVATSAFKEIKSFWDVNTGKITNSAMKDDVLTRRGGNSATKLGAYILAGFTAGKPNEVDPRTVSEWPKEPKLAAKGIGEVTQKALDLAPKLDGGENPAFTFNAFAMEPEPGIETTSGLPKRFVFGDGLLTYLRVAKYGDSSIKAIIGHEYGHHLQFELGTDYPEATVPEQTRHAELEADAFGNYWAAHVNGGKFTKVQRDLSIKLFADMGDCDVKDDGHHGTPAQRGAAATWGQQLADTQKKKGQVFAAESVRLKYNKALPELLAAK